MLVLTRKVGEKVIIGGNITLTVVKVDGNQVRLAFDAPPQVRILRNELIGRPRRVVSAEELADPDLEEKPLEWADNVPCGSAHR
jgi:carbon storage regulator